MRIAVISRVFSKSGGGAESYSVALVQQLVARHEFHVFAQDSNHPVGGVHHHKLFCLSRKPRWVNQLVFAIASWWQTRSGFDVVHSHENTWHGQIQTIHVRPIRCNLFAAPGGTGRFFQWVKIALSPRLITYLLLEGARFKDRPARKVVAASENLRLECERAYPARLGEVTVVMPGTNLPRESISRSAARRQLGLPENGNWVLFVANDYERKGLDTLLQAMMLLSADSSLIVVGNPRYVPRYRQQALRLGLSERIHFLGSLDDLAPAYLGRGLPGPSNAGGQLCYGGAGGHGAWTASGGEWSGTLRHCSATQRRRASTFVARPERRATSGQTHWFRAGPARNRSQSASRRRGVCRTAFVGEGRSTI